MNFLAFVLALFCLGQVNAKCPRKADLSCNMYDTTNCPAGTAARYTYIEYNGVNCDSCRMCLPESATNGCPVVQCPYEDITTFYPMDCGVTLHPQKTYIDGYNCDACATFTFDCSDISWTG